ncbi:hypothetical protein COHA_009771 [Chlorella ohadii]|uniref:Chorismate synthase n=1 Tax=Chlorella ohadii TaxID=2649997 RepID=A0AAD5DHK8_9CHLO|nr:hypothetical protein COHA_009771 [Chlorella ohadii]
MAAASLCSSVRLLVQQPRQQRGGRRSLRVQAAGSTFGHAFRVTTFGESHGGGVGCVIDGVPPRMQITQEEIQYELDRRRPGQSKITTPRKETDTCEILSGMAPDGTTTLGSPICVLVRNKDQKSQDYSEMEQAYRPSHADATYDFKYGIRAVAGGGRSSARETIGRVAAGAVAKKLLRQVAGTEVLAYVNRVRDVEASGVDHESMTLEQIESNPVRCPDPASAEAMYKAIDAAELAKAIMSLPATKGFEIGSGFSGSRMVGSEHNDEFYMDEQGEVRTRTNRSGGIQGGISNGEHIVIRVAFKPTATIAQRQATVSREGKDIELLARGRHDPCVVPRAVPMVESMVALVLADQLLQHYAQCELLPRDSALGPDAKARSQFQHPVHA